MMETCLHFWASQGAGAECVKCHIVRAISLDDATPDEWDRASQAVRRGNAGKIWLADEYETLKLNFASGMPLVSIANNHGRTAGAVVAKLVSLGLLIMDRHGFYHRVDPDPWCGPHDIRAIDKSNTAA